MLVPLILLGDGCARQRDAALAGWVVVAGVGGGSGRAGRAGCAWNGTERLRSRRGSRSARRPRPG